MSIPTACKTREEKTIFALVQEDNIALVQEDNIALVQEDNICPGSIRYYLP